MVRRVAAVAVLLLLPASAAHAQWSPPATLAPIGAPRALVPDALGGLQLFASGPQPARYRWPASGGSPARTPLPRFAGGGLWQPWAANARGDVVMTSGSFGDAVRGLAAQVDDAHRFLTVRVRPPGGAFGSPVVIGAPGPVRTLNVAVRADGLVEFVLAYYEDEDDRHVLLHGELRDGVLVAPPARVASTRAGAPFALELVPGGPGEGRVGRSPARSGGACACCCTCGCEPPGSRPTLPAGCDCSAPRSASRG